MPENFCVLFLDPLVNRRQCESGDKLQKLSRNARLREVSCKLLWSVNDQRWELKRQLRKQQELKSFFQISSSLCLWPPLEPGSRSGQWVRTRVTLRRPLCPSVDLLCEPLPCASNHIPNNQTPGSHSRLFDTTNIILL